MQFLADVELVCEECKGTRYKSGVLEIRYKGLNIHEVLQLTVREAIGFFSRQPDWCTGSRCWTTWDSAICGWGSPPLRSRAAKRSASSSRRTSPRRPCEGTLFIFDEPTTGLHFDDIAKLLDAFQRLIENGGSILIIEHNLDVIRAADWVIDLGPEGGDAGGRIVAQGTPEQIAEAPGSYTGHFLRAVLNSAAS